MNLPQQALMIAAFTTLVGCTSASVPATMSETSVQPLRLYATTATFPLVTDLTRNYTDQYLTFEAQSGNFRSALNTLLEGETAYIITSHLPPPDTLPMPLWAAPIAQDGIAMIVHPSNPLIGLSLDQIRDIYQGRVNSWRGLSPSDGQHANLVLFSREDSSDTRAEFERLVMGHRRTSQAARLVTSSRAMLNAIASTPGGIGYISLAEADASVKTLFIDDIAATQMNVLTHQYPLRSTIFIVGQQEPLGLDRVFIGWVQGVEGQQIVKRYYAPLTNTE